MKHASLAGAAAIVVVANLFALVHAARNRSGQPDAQVTLTDRELTYYRNADDSGVQLNLMWADSYARFYVPGLNYAEQGSRVWLTRPELESLGFDCRVAASDPKADSFYARQRPRRGFVAMELDGPAFQSWLEVQKRLYEQQPGVRTTFNDKLASRLVAIDAAGDPAALRARHSDHSGVVILPAVVQIYVVPRMPAGNGRPERPAELTGMIQQVPSGVHVPRPLSDAFRRMPVTTRVANEDKPVYRVHLTYGRLLEPWVTGVEFTER
jgi:hypothetical protein